MFQVGETLIRLFSNESSLPQSNESENVEILIKILVRINLDEKIRSSSLYSIYSTLAGLACSSLKAKINHVKISEWFTIENNNDPLIRIEICRIVSKSIYRELYDTLIMKTISNILKPEKNVCDDDDDDASMIAALPLKVR